MRRIKKDILKWKQSSIVNGAFIMALVHDMVVSKDFSDKVDKIFKRANELTKNDS